VDIAQRTVPANRILGAVPLHELTAIQDDLIPLQLHAGQVLCDVDQETTQVVFPERAVISLCSALSDGESVEVQTAGVGGIAGVWVVAGRIRSPWRWTVQLPGLAFAMERETFRRHVERLPHLRDAAIRYEMNAHLITADTVACNRFHELIQRLARMLLVLGDMSASDRLPITHEALSQMLGVHRPSVTLALESLRTLDCVSLHRGLIELDRARLELVVCECYQRMRAFADAATRPT
jgi:CRP-like cAMP-binding protein